VKLAQQRHTLEQAMQEFKARVQKAHPQDADVELRNIKSWEDVASTVESMMCRLKEKQETSKFRRATKHLRTFCNTVNAHSTALKMLPTNNDYVSVFYGALATVLQVRHAAHW
jgi:tRNA-dihydrouridine synthase